MSEELIAYKAALSEAQEENQALRNRIVALRITVENLSAELAEYKAKAEGQQAEPAAA
ncbi:hypothetical protein GCM10017635_09210 [Paracoccus kondratievae]|uniref:Uncharacterized protein n=2 Tax=Paracoccus kondratievae TaxID=135740 RepID=A0AAD3RT56_9RHOB|nr:hypothetical protein [uncultured Paracoccus sp.]AZV00297.1 hypothetical protein pkon1_p68 [Paracoccus phage vB_PkoS_Pkon1]GLK63451.1 hypothetical protein GCM10017635_09210 [Paracoccus kondratievae]